MKVILITDVKKVGQRGEVKDVADGYALSVLIPKKQALPATKENLKKHERAQAEKRDHKRAEEEQLERLIKNLNGKEVSIQMPANESGGLFKAVTPDDVVRGAREVHHVALPPLAVVIREPIKHTGTYNIELVGGREKGVLRLVVAK